nr:leucine rich repeats and IQ motif containing 3 [Rousettus aegyptiacus]
MAVTMAKDAEESVSLTVRESSSKKKYAAQRRKAKDDLTIQCGLQKLWQDKFNYLEKVRERRALFLEEKKQKAEERLLIQNLNNERAILAKGMINMDRLNKKEAVLREKSLIVQQKLEREKYLKELRKYMKDLRAQEIYKRHCEEKFVLDMITFQKACERIQDAKTKVALVKTNLVLKVPSGMRE